LRQPFGIVGVLIASEPAVHRLLEQRDELVLDVATGTAFMEVIVGCFGESQGVIELATCQESCIGGDGSTVKFQADFGVEFEPERGFFAVTHRVPPL
jgi:hypothetical protein